MEVAVQNDGTTVNARTALGVVVIDPSSGAAITDFGGASDAGDAVLPPNAAQEANGNLAAIATAAGHQGDAPWNGTGNGGIIAILKASWTALTGTMSVSVTGKVRTGALTSTSTAGATVAGAITASFANTGSSAASVAGGTLPAGCAVTFDVPAGDTLGAIAYDATGTTLMISTVA